MRHISKAALARKEANKGILSNTRLKFDDDGNAYSAAEYTGIQSAGLDLTEAKQRLVEVDKDDQLAQRKRIRQKHKLDNKKRKELRRKPGQPASKDDMPVEDGDDEGVTLGGFEDEEEDGGVRLGGFTEDDEESLIPAAKGKKRQIVEEDVEGGAKKGKKKSAAAKKIGTSLKLETTLKEPILAKESGRTGKKSKNACEDISPSAMQTDEDLALRLLQGWLSSPERFFLQNDFLSLVGLSNNKNPKNKKTKFRKKNMPEVPSPLWNKQKQGRTIRTFLY